MSDETKEAPSASDLLKNSSLYREFQAEREEILRHKWIESEKAGRDIGFERALTDWIIKHRSKCQGTMTNLKARNHKVEGRKKTGTRILISLGSLRLQDPKYLRRYGRVVSVPESATLEDRAATASGFGLRTSAFGPPPPPYA